MLCLAYPSPPNSSPELTSAWPLPWGPRASLASFLINTSFLGFGNPIPSTGWYLSRSLSLMPSFLTCACADAGQLITFPEGNCLASSLWPRLIPPHMSVGAGPKSHITQTMLHGKHTTPENAFPILRGLRSSPSKQNWGIYSPVLISEQFRSVPCPVHYNSHIG